MPPSADPPSLSELSKAQEKLLRAKHRNARFTKEKQDIDKEEEELEKQKRCLATKRLMLLGQYRDWVDKALTNGTILPYCKAWNQNFAMQLQKRLPREIRDMVYKHLWRFDPDRTSAHLKGRLHVLQHYTFTCAFCTPDTMAMFPGLIDIAQSLVQVDHEELRQLFDQSLLPHYLSPEYVGALTAHEVGVSFYLSICTEDLLQCQSHRISSVLRNDALHLDLPTMDLITSLTVHCKLDRYRTPPPDHKLSAKCNHSLSETAQVDQDVLKRDFSALLDIKKKQGFRLHVIIYQRNIRLAVLEEAMYALDEFFRSFQENGASLKVTWTYRGHWENAVGPPCHELVACELRPRLDPTLGLSPGHKWDDELLQVLEVVDDIILPQHARFYKEPFKKPEAHDRKGINRFVHSMYETDEEADNADDDEDIPPVSRPDSDSDDDEDGDDDGDYEPGYCAAHGHGHDDE